MNVNLGIWQTLTRAVMFLLGVAFLLGLFLWYLPLIQKNERFRNEIMALDAKTQAEERLAKQLHSSMDAVQNDPRTLERLVRERLGYARTNESVIRFQGPVK